jgi:hypothetical protein
MKVRMLGEREVHGVLAMIYGEPGTGKTVSTLLSLPRPILYYALDPRDVERTMAGNIVDMGDIEIREPDNFLDLIEDLNLHRAENVGRFKSMVIDPISYLSNVILLGEIEKETGEAQVFDTKKRFLVNSMRSDQTGYGALASWMKRLCAVLGLYAKDGLIVVCIALLSDSPKWNKELSAAPAFAGREFNRDMPGYYDLIGLVEPRVDSNGTIVYPPAVNFRSPDGSYIAKWSGPQNGKTRGPLNWEKILNTVATKSKQKEDSIKEVAVEA